MKEELKPGDKVAVMDQGLLMIQRFAPPGARPNNHGVIESIVGSLAMIEFTIGDDDPEEHSQLAPYPLSILIRRA